MASTNHTQHFGLSLWEPEDQFLRTDLNADNPRLDAALGQNRDTARRALDDLTQVTATSTTSSCKTTTRINTPSIKRRCYSTASCTRRPSAPTPRRRSSAAGGGGGRYTTPMVVAHKLVMGELTWSAPVEVRRSGQRDRAARAVARRCGAAAAALPDRRPGGGEPHGRIRGQAGAGADAERPRGGI